MCVRACVRVCVCPDCIYSRNRTLSSTTFQSAGSVTLDGSGGTNGPPACDSPYGEAGRRSSRDTETQRHGDTETQRQGPISQLAGLGQAVSGVYHSVPEHQVLMLKTEAAFLPARRPLRAGPAPSQPRLVLICSASPRAPKPAPRCSLSAPSHRLFFVFFLHFEPF